MVPDIYMIKLYACRVYVYICECIIRLDIVGTKVQQQQRTKRHAMLLYMQVEYM